MAISAVVVNRKLNAVFIGPRVYHRIRYSKECVPNRAAIIAARMGKVDDLRVFDPKNVMLEEWFQRMPLTEYPGYSHIRLALLHGKVRDVLDFSRSPNPSVTMNIDTINGAFLELARVYEAMYGKDHDLSQGFNYILSDNILHRWHSETEATLITYGAPASSLRQTATSIVLNRLNTALHSWQDHAFRVLSADFTTEMRESRDPRLGEATARVAYGTSPLLDFFGHFCTSQNNIIIPLPTYVSPAPPTPLKLRHTPEVVASPLTLSEGVEAPLGAPLPTAVTVMIRSGLQKWADVRSSHVNLLRTGGKPWCFRPFTQSSPCSSCPPGNPRHHQDVSTSVVKEDSAVH
jgi:hypothetical protein